MWFRELLSCCIFCLCYTSFLSWSFVDTASVPAQYNFLWRLFPKLRWLLFLRWCINESDGWIPLQLMECITKRKARMCHFYCYFWLFYYLHLQLQNGHCVASVGCIAGGISYALAEFIGCAWWGNSGYYWECCYYNSMASFLMRLARNRAHGGLAHWVDWYNIVCLCYCLVKRVAIWYNYFLEWITAWFNCSDDYIIIYMSWVIFIPPNV